jgi:SAM-dependent methyltransferase
MDRAEMDRTPFADLDRNPAEMVTLLLAALARMARHPEIRRVRQVAYDALAPVTGKRLLDAGCGGGEVARQLAAAGAEVVAMDYSAATIAAARERHDGSAVTYMTGDVCSIDLTGDSMDGVWCERVLQHLTDPGRAIGEFVRITRPGGRVCLIDTDWDSMAFDGPHPGLAAAVVQHTSRHFSRGQRDMGRTLRRRLVAAGLSDVRAAPVTCYFSTPESAGVILPMVNPDVPVEAGVWPPDEREQWLAAVAESGARGDFLAVLTIWVVAGTV